MKSTFKKVVLDFDKISTDPTFDRLTKKDVVRIAGCGLPGAADLANEDRDKAIAARRRFVESILNPRAFREND